MKFLGEPMRSKERSEAKSEPAKPTYLGLLNAIAIGEARADEVLRTWRDATGSSDLAQVLEFVAIREREHAAAFTKRLCELGFSVRESPSATHDTRLSLAASKVTDQEKFKTLLDIVVNSEGEDPFSGIFLDKTIDPATGALLGRYIAEERDSDRRLRAALAAFASDDPKDEVLDDIARRLERLTETLEELKSLRG